MGEYSRRNLACASHHRCPDGYKSWGGNMSGWQKRPYCWEPVGHAGDHWAQTQPVSDTGAITGPSERMTWPNTIGIPIWLAATTMHGLEMLKDHDRVRKADKIEDLIAELNGART